MQLPRPLCLTASGMGLALIALVSPTSAPGQAPTAQAPTDRAQPAKPDSATGLTPEQVMAIQRVLSVYPNPRDGRVAFTRTTPRQPNEPAGGTHVQLLLREPDGSLRTLLERGARGVAWHPDARQLTFVAKREGDAAPQLYTIDATPENAKPRRLTEIATGVGSYQWRPDGRGIAFTALEPRDAADLAARQAGYRPVIVDEDSRPLTLWWWSGETKEVRRLTQKVSVYGFEWSPDGKRLAAAIAPRNSTDDSYMSKRLHLVGLDGSVTPWVANPGKLGSMTWSPDSRHLAYISAHNRRDPHAGMLYLATVGSDSAKALTPGLKGMVQSARFVGGKKIEAVISFGVEDSVLQIDPARIELESQRAEPIDNSPAFHSVHAGHGPRSGLWLVGSTAQHPPELYWSDGKSFTRQTDSNPWLKDIPLGRQRVVRYTARDGLLIEGVLMYPVDYTEGQRYPMVIVAHGGPESHFSDGWNTSYGRQGQMLCARGYFAWYPNYRASTGYGVEFVMADHGDPMGREFEDHLDAITYFDQEGLIDKSRVGIGGGSYGGYTAAWAATRHSRHFAAAISFVPFVDIHTKWLTSDIPNEFYLVHYEEKWPHEQAGFLADRSPLRWAQHCDTPLLLLGGTSDPRVHPSQPFMLYRAVKFATDTPVRYVQYPGEGHGNRTNVYQYDYALRSLRWFDHYLKPGQHRDDALPPYRLDYSALLPDSADDK